MRNMFFYEEICSFFYKYVTIFIYEIQCEPYINKVNVNGWTIHQENMGYV
jgi:hypothetical protein